MPDRLPPAVELSMPADSAGTTLLAALVTHFPVRPDPVVTTVATCWDTFDGRLHAARLELWRTSTGPDRPDVVTLVRSGVADTTGSLRASRADRFFAPEVGPGPLRTRLEEVTETRALLCQARVHSRTSAVRVCNSDDKTVVRLSIQTPEVRRRAGAAVVLTTRVRVVPVLGYDKEFDRVIAVLTGAVGLQPAEWSLAEEAVVAAGGTPGGVSANVAVPLAREMRADVATLDIARRLAEVVEANLAGTLDDVDTEFLHDLRVAVRRTRSLLKEMKGVLAPPDEEQARVDLRWIQEITGPVRDLDVQLEEWPHTVASTPDAFAGDLQPLHDLLHSHREQALRKMRRALRGKRYQDGWTRWQAVMAHPLAERRDRSRPNAARPIADVAGHRIAAVYRKMVQMGQAIDDGSPPEALHDLRKRGKELRYLLELFGSLWPDEIVSPMVSTLKSLQDVLGRFQDDQVQATYLRTLGPELAATPGGTDALIALGFIVEHLTADQAAARGAFAKRFASFAGPEQREVVDTVFRPARQRGPDGNRSTATNATKPTKSKKSKKKKQQA